MLSLALLLLRSQPPFLLPCPHPLSFCLPPPYPLPLIHISSPKKLIPHPPPHPPKFSPLVSPVPHLLPSSSPPFPFSPPLDPSLLPFVFPLTPHPPSSYPSCPSSPPLFIYFLPPPLLPCRGSDHIATPALRESCYKHSPFEAPQVSRIRSP